MLRIHKRLAVSARSAHALLREILVFALGWVEVYSDPGTGSFGLLLSGADGETNTALPTTFTSPSGTFSGMHVGKYLVIGGASTPMNMRGVHKIVAAPSATTLIVSSGLYGSVFSTAMSLPWRIVDPTLNTDATQFVVQGPSGTATPAWQARFHLNTLDTDKIRAEVGPWGGNSGGSWLMPATDTVHVTCDTPSVWYFLVDDEAVKMFTEAASGTDVFDIGYVGTCVPRNPAVDDHFAVSWSDSDGDIEGIGYDDLTNVQYQPILLTPRNPGTSSIMQALPNSPYDLRRDLADFGLSTSVAGFEEMDRGSFRGVKQISTHIAYRTFVDNGRAWLSLGNGLAFAWDGSVSP